MVAVVTLTTMLITSCVEPVKPLSHDENPAWVPVVSPKYSVNMTIVCRIQMDPSLPASQAVSPLNKEDLFVAFIADQPRAVAFYDEGDFFFTIPAEANEGGVITFRYYSATQHHIFTAAETCDFVLDQSLGTIDDPLILTLHP